MTASGWLIPGSEPRPRTSIWGRRVWHAEGDQPGGQLLQRLPEGVEHLNRSRVPLGRGRRGEHGDGDLLIVHVDAGTAGWMISLASPAPGSETGRGRAAREARNKIEIL